MPNPGIEIDAFGTGFLIASNLLITNHHVFPFKELAEGCAVNFQYEFNQFGKLESGQKFRLRPEKFYFSRLMLDFAIVYVESVHETM